MISLIPWKSSLTKTGFYKNTLSSIMAIIPQVPSTDSLCFQRIPWLLTSTRWEQTDESILRDGLWLLLQPFVLGGFWSFLPGGHASEAMILGPKAQKLELVCMGVGESLHSSPLPRRACLLKQERIMIKSWLGSRLPPFKSQVHQTKHVI